MQPVVAVCASDGVGELRARDLALRLAAGDAAVTVLVVEAQGERTVRRFGDVTVIWLPARTLGGLRHRVRRARGTLVGQVMRRGVLVRNWLEEERHHGRRRHLARLLPGLARLREIALRSDASEPGGQRSADPGSAERALVTELSALRPDAVYALDPIARRSARQVGLTVRDGLDAPAAPARRPRLLIGPRNGNGQAWAWARTAEVHVPGLGAAALAVAFPAGGLELDFPADLRVPLEDWGSRRWQRWWEGYVLDGFTHVLVETGEPVLGRLHGDDAFADLPVLRERGLEVGLIFRGSELRDPRAHARREPHSPFADARDPLTARLQERADRLHAHLAGFDGPCFVTTLDLLDDLPRARWLPHVLDLDRWTTGPPALERPLPVVVHAPTRDSLKGSQVIDAVCERLAASGRIEYRRLRGIPSGNMPAALRGSDVLVDQVVGVGAYGALALQGMATGRVVVAHLPDRVRGRIDAGVPIVQATPDSLSQVLDGILVRRGEHAEIAAAGRAHVERFHAGPCSAGRLAAFVRG